ncbi:hypothetical protein NDA18_000893 [Ustilago nuda]|nr:hypothetical protein NDA18_000893 [Ustilago nuda]
MKLAACLLPRRLPSHQHAFLLPFLTQPPPIASRSYYSKSHTSPELEWDAETLEAMRSSSRTASASSKKKPPKTWASTHTTKSSDATATTRVRTTTKSKSPYIVYQWKQTPEQKAKEARLKDLEQNLQVYTHTIPAGPPHVAGTAFLQPLSKPWSSSVTLDQPISPSSAEPPSSHPLHAYARLKAPSIAYTADFDEAQDLLSCLGPGPMGLDLEWNISRFVGASRTALLQICSPTLIVILHLSAMSHRIPPLLRTILEDPTIIKTGVAIKNDALKLQRDYFIHTRNALELGNLAKLAQPQKWAGVNHLISLRDLTRIYLGKKLKKDSVRVSDWERFPLEKGQIEYAASDTFASLEVLRAIAEYFRGEGKGAGKENEMGLEEALKLSAYDLWLEKMQHSAGEKQKDILRAALKEVQPAPQSQPQPQVQEKAKAKPHATTSTNPQPKAKAKAKAKPASTTTTSSSDDEGIQVTKVLLAHDRAMQSWLYSSQTLTQIATSSGIKPSTIVQYLLKALLLAKQRRAKSPTKGSTTFTILDDFSIADRLRLDKELGDKEGGPQMSIARSRFRVLAKSLGWGSVDSWSDSEGSEVEKGKKRGGRGTGVIEVESSDDDDVGVDVADVSR